MNPLRSLLRALVGARSDDEHDDEDSVAAGYASNEIEADAWKTILARNGIGSAVIGPARVPMYGMIDFKIRLEVLYRDLAEAREILGIGEDGFPITEPDEETDD